MYTKKWMWAMVPVCALGLAACDQQGAETDVEETGVEGIEGDGAVQTDPGGEIQGDATLETTVDPQPREVDVNVQRTVDPPPMEVEVPAQIEGDIEADVEADVQEEQIQVDPMGQPQTEEEPLGETGM